MGTAIGERKSQTVPRCGRGECPVDERPGSCCQGCRDRRACESRCYQALEHGCKDRWEV